MTTELARTTPARALATGGGGFALPAVIADQGDKAAGSGPTPQGGSGRQVRR